MSTFKFPTKVTPRLLQALGACQSGIDEFYAAHPGRKSVPITEKTIRSVADTYHLNWFADVVAKRAGRKADLSARIEKSWKNAVCTCGLGETCALIAAEKKARLSFLRSLIRERDAKKKTTTRKPRRVVLPFAA